MVPAMRDISDKVNTEKLCPFSLEQRRLKGNLIATEDFEEFR